MNGRRLRSNGRETGSEDDDRPESQPSTLRDGQKRFVGFVDGFATYYDVHQHRIDIRLERFDGTYYMTGYYQLRREESVADFVRTVEEHGSDCADLSGWVRRQLRPDRPHLAGLLRDVRERIECLVRAVR